MRCMLILSYLDSVSTYLYMPNNDTSLMCLCITCHNIYSLLVMFFIHFPQELSQRPNKYIH